MSNETRTITLPEATWLRLETLALGLDEQDVYALLERLATGIVRIAPPQPDSDGTGRPETWTLLKHR